MEVSFTPNTIVVTKVCTVIPKHIYVLKLCIHDLNEKKKVQKIQKEINSLTSISNVGQFDHQITILIPQRLAIGFYIFIFLAIFLFLSVI